jgi:hypothetical protein
MQEQKHSMESSESGSQPQSIPSKLSKELCFGPQAAADHYLASRVPRFAGRATETAKTGGLKHPPSSCSSCFENDSEPFPYIDILQPSSLMLYPESSITTSKVSLAMAHPPAVKPRSPGARSRWFCNGGTSCPPESHRSRQCRSTRSAPWGRC